MDYARELIDAQAENKPKGKAEAYREYMAKEGAKPAAFEAGFDAGEAYMAQKVREAMGET